MFSKEYNYENLLNPLKNETNKIKNQFLNLGANANVIEALMESVKTKMMDSIKSEDYTQDLYRSILVRKETEDNVLIKSLLNCQFFIFRTEYNCPFITSDNPGFSIKNNSEFYNLNLGYVQQLRFPLSPKSFLFIDFRLKEKLETPIKEIYFLKASLDMINYFNLGTTFLSNEFIFGNFKDQLKITRQLLISNTSNFI